MTVSDEDVNKATNGSLFREFQTQKFSELEGVINDSFKESHRILRDGFQLIASELRVTRDSGVVPVPLLDKILTSNNEAYKEMFKAITDANKETSKSSNETYRYLLKMVCAMMVGVLAWVTGMKVFLPDKVVQVTSQITEAKP